METGTVTEQMVLNLETQCLSCLIAKTYHRYALKTTKFLPILGDRLVDSWLSELPDLLAAAI